MGRRGAISSACAIIPFSAFAVYALKGDVERKMTSGHRIFGCAISEFDSLYRDTLGPSLAISAEESKRSYHGSSNR